jgi:hypothetical protein
MMAKAVLAALCVGAILGGVSACDGDYINKCDSDGCAAGSYTCPSACANKRTLSSNVRTDAPLASTTLVRAFPWVVHT